MKRIYWSALLVSLAVGSAVSQHHYSSWVRRNATDTTIVRCWYDSLSSVRFPANCYMGMMYPDSIYCRIDRMRLDSLLFPYDSTFIGWHRMQIGTDSTHFEFMGCGYGTGYNSMIQFFRNLRCDLYWDSLSTDSLHRHWRPTGVVGWNGSQWVALSNVSISGNVATVITPAAYSALAFVGQPAAVSSVTETKRVPGEFVLSQNYPNPFNPNTSIKYELPERSHVTLTVFNTLGQQVATLVHEEKGAGYYEVKFAASGLSSGVYFYRLTGGTYVQTRKLLLLR